jgi:hypothetical protein
MASINRLTRIGKLRRMLAATTNYLLLVFANVFPCLPILFTLMMEAIPSSETTVLTRGTRRHIREEGILQMHSSYTYIYIALYLNLIS